MTYYTVCPTCGYKLLKAGDGSNIEIHCPKCSEKMTIEKSALKSHISEIIHFTGEPKKITVSDLIPLSDEKAGQLPFYKLTIKGVYKTMETNEFKTMFEADEKYRALIWASRQLELCG